MVETAGCSCKARVADAIKAAIWGDPEFFEKTRRLARPCAQPAWDPKDKTRRMLDDHLEIGSSCARGDQL